MSFRARNHYGDLRSSRGAGVLAFVLMLGACDASAGELPRVRLIAAGGTIVTNRTGTHISASELVHLIPDLGRFVRAELEEFSTKGSTELTLAQLHLLSRLVNDRLAEDPGLAGVVVTMGTDTLEEVAYFLDLTVAGDRTVVVAGSMRSPDTLGYDGAANLRAAFRVAADPASRGMGVLVVANDEINAAREVTKADAQRVHTFQSHPAGILGVVDNDRVFLYRRPARQPSASPRFDIKQIKELPRVDIVSAYFDAPGDLIACVARAGGRGLVIAGTGAGHTTGTQEKALAAAIAEGLVVVMSSRTGSGRVAPRRDGASPADRIYAENLTPVKARILLMLALAQTRDRVEIQRMFSEY
jgi:L-asparaginase